MADGIGFRESIKIECRRMKEMTWKERWIQFRTYYLWKTVFLVIVIGVSISALHSYVLSKRDVVISGAMVNTAVNDQGEDFLTDEYFADIQGDKHEQSIKISPGIHIDFATGNITTENTAAYNSLYAQISATDIDYIILDEAGYNFLETEKMYVNLADILSQDTMEALGDKVINGNAIDLGKTVLAREYQLNPTPAYIVFIANGVNLEQADDFVRYLYQLDETETR